VLKRQIFLKPKNVPYLNLPESPPYETAGLKGGYFIFWQIWAHGDI